MSTGAEGSGGFGNGLAELAFTGETNSDITVDGKIAPTRRPPSSTTSPPIRISR